VVPLELLSPDEFELTALTAKYASDAWLYGQKLPFTLSVEDHFLWGGIEIQLDVNEGIIRSAKVYTDAMDETLAPRLETALTGCAFRLPALQSALGELSLPNVQTQNLLSLLERGL
jgi:lipoate-protein ligase A